MSNHEKKGGGALIRQKTACPEINTLSFHALSLPAFFWGYQDTFHAKDFSCLTVMGHTSVMKDYLNAESLRGATAVFIDRAETLLHDNYGDAYYWSARRSMVFSAVLRAVGDRFRAEFLDSNDERDGTLLDSDWRNNEREPGSAKGGPYLAIHLRYLFWRISLWVKNVL